ncbi:MAG TPA: PAS domain S-box protein [Gemmataceae bacterium]|nr:PAS domain S-box protein [Gemmataceae bacterium]
MNYSAVEQDVGGARDAPDPSSTAPALSQHEAEAILRQLAGELDAPPDDLQLHQDARPAPSQRPDEGATELRAAAPALGAGVLDGLLEAMPDALVVVDAHGCILRVNAQTERMFGYDRSELLGRQVETLVPEPLRDRHVGQRNGYIAAPHVRPMGQGLLLHGLRKDGQEVPVEISLSPLQTDGGLLVVACIRDISERKKAEAALRRMEARYRTLVEGIPAVTFMAALDESANELYVSPQIEELLGYSQQEWMENPILWYTQLHPDDRNRWHTEFARTCLTGEPFRAVYRFVSRAGRVVWVHGEAKVLRDDDGRPLFLQGVAFDVTGIKHAEEELKTLNQTLEQRVAERTEAVEERARELERSNKDLQEYAFFVAHELKEPLSHSISYSQMLERSCAGRLDAAAERYLTKIVQAGHRMSTLIQMMLKYAKVGKGSKGFAAVDSGRALEAACAELQAAVAVCNAEVTGDTLPVVWAVESELVQVFQNLVGNAIKFRGERPVHVHVGALRQGDDWRFSVHDNGIGIDPDYLARKMFTIFEREHAQSKYPGTGIGLALCKKVVEHHGGRIWAESRRGEGSTFHFTLPAVGG